MESDRTTTSQRGDLDAVTVLAEPNRRALYDFVVAQQNWVSREQAAEAIGLARGIASHHLDRLAEEGLLDVEYRRLNDRSGPGAGRPAKLYRRAPSEIAVSLPPRDYELAGRLLAEAVDNSERDGTPIALSIDRAARNAGRQIAAEAAQGMAQRAGVAARRTRLFEALRSRGFEPRTLDGAVVLNNCPFHQLAQSHTALICAMNLSLLDGVLTELEGTGLRARLEPEDGYCCVRFDPDPAPGVPEGRNP